MEKKALQTPDQIINALNVAMAKSNALDGDCKGCQVRRIGRVTDEEAKYLGRNWNIDMVNGECQGDCMTVLEQTAKELGKKFDAVWLSMCRPTLHSRGTGYASPSI